MKVILSAELLNLLKNNLSKILPVKIIKTGPRSTLISIAGKKFEIPNILDKNKFYSATIKNNEITINEKNLFNRVLNDKEPDFKEDIKKLTDFIDKLYINDEKKHHFLENQLKEFNLFQNFSTIIDSIDKDGKGGFYFQGRENKNFFFLFDLPFFNRMAKVFINIGAFSKISINILVGKAESINQDEFLTEIKGALKSRSKNIFLKITDDKNEFLGNIMNCFDKNIDIKI